MKLDGIDGHYYENNIKIIKVIPIDAKPESTVDIKTIGKMQINLKSKPTICEQITEEEVKSRGKTININETKPLFVSIDLDNISKYYQKIWFNTKIDFLNK